METKFFKTGVTILITSMGLMSCTEKDFPVTEPTSAISVTTLAPANVTTSTAYLRGTFNSSKPEIIIENGILLTELSGYEPEAPSMISGLGGKKFTGVNEGTGNFFVSLTNLKADTRYGYAAFATTLSGTSYGNMKILVTSYGTVDDADGYHYQTVRIGKQIWMRENLKSTNYSNQIPIIGHYDLVTDEIFGKHYSWAAASGITPDAKAGTSNGVCPTGWHIPGDSEWKELLSFVGVPEDQLNSLNLIGGGVAELLKDGGIDSWSDEKANNGTGFSALPAGIVCQCEQEWNCETAFWTSTPNIYYGFQKVSEKILRGNHPNCSCGLSVRCVRDQDL
jgi:uncharacterized protein (TIGR02145 family)